MEVGICCHLVTVLWSAWKELLNFVLFSLHGKENKSHWKISHSVNSLIVKMPRGCNIFFCGKSSVPIEGKICTILWESLFVPVFVFPGKLHLFSWEKKKNHVKKKVSFFHGKDLDQYFFQLIVSIIVSRSKGKLKMGIKQLFLFFFLRRNINGMQKKL